MDIAKRLPRRRERGRAWQAGAPALGLTTAGLALGAAVYEHRALAREARERERFRCRTDAPLPGELQRALNARLDGAINGLESHGGDWADPVHDARTSIKRARTVLRLTRGGLGEARYRRHNDALRAASRRLAPLRDALVLLEALDDTVREFPDQSDAREIQALRSRLATRRAAVLQPQTAHEPIAAAIVLLRSVRDDLERRPADDASLYTAVRAYRRAYSRGRKAYRKAAHTREREELHTWRKRVKDLRHASELLRDGDPATLKPIRRSAKSLSDMLGEDHDLAVLAEQAREYPTVGALIGRRRQTVQQAAFELAAELYAQSPRRLARHVLRRARKRTAWR